MMFLSSAHNKKYINRTAAFKKPPFGVFGSLMRKLKSAQARMLGTLYRLRKQNALKAFAQKIFRSKSKTNSFAPGGEKEFVLQGL